MAEKLARPGTRLSWGGGRGGDRIVCGFRTSSRQRPPSHVTSQVLPDTLQSPDHMQLPVRKVFDEAIGHKACDVLPVVVAFVSKFFLQHRANRNQGRKSVSEENEL